MNKIKLIIQREYLTRVKKKSFLIMTLLAPVLLAGMIIIPVLIMTNQGKEEKKIAIIEDGTRFFEGKINSTEYLKFDYLTDVRFEDLKKNFSDLGYNAVLYISPKVSAAPDAVQLISHKQPSLEVTEYISSSIEKVIEHEKLKTFNIDDLDKILKTVETKIRLKTIIINEAGEEKETSTGIAMAIAYIGGLLIYMLTFIFGAQVMRGVIEEKTNRIVEVLISSVRPFQLMMGKIIGIALVGLTQFFLWIVLTMAIVTTVQGVLLNKSGNLQEKISQTTEMVPGAAGQTEALQMNQAAQIFETLGAVNWGLILFSFVIYFLGGYLLYASLFAAVGSAVDNETDTQQFMMPITIPLLLALFIAMGAFQNPDSQLAFWCSFIPFTSPIVMMARIPFGIHTWELIVSISLLILTFIGTTWMAAKIYRTGILMYGKKPTYKELWKWLRYKHY